MPSYVRSGAAIAVSSLNAATQMRSNVRALADGGFMVVWQSSDPAADGSGYAVRAQRYNAQGVAVGAETLINNLTAGDQNWPRFATLSSGGYVVTWETRDSTQDGSGAAIKARIFDASGTPLGGEFRVNTHAAGDQTQPDVIAFSDGGFLIAWNTNDSTQDGFGGAAKAQRFDSTGAPVGAEFLLNSVAFGNQLNIDLATLANGGFVATWQTNNSSGTQVKGQVYAADGTPIGAEFNASDGTGTHMSGRVTALQGGGFILIWNSGSSALAQVFDATGIKVGARLSIPASNAEIAALANGTLLVTWTDLYGSIKAQVYDTAGQALGPQTTVHQGGSATGLGSGQSVAVLANGNIVLSWDHLHSGGGNIDIKAQILRPNTGLDLGAATRTASTAENGFWQLDVLAQIAPVDSPGMAITYSIVGGADASKFILTAAGELRFNSSSNYEAPTDSNGDNVYDVIVRASDGEFSDEQTISVSVTNVNEAPNITSNGGDFNASVSTAENQNIVTTVTATDPEASALTYSIVSGADRARFTINASTGVLSFVSAPNFEAPADSDGNNVYLVTVAASDGTKSDSQALSITITNVNEAPIIAGSQTNYLHNENDTAVATLSASDGDGNTVTWSIAGGADAALFAIDAATGALRFVAAPNFEAPADDGANNIYNVVVSASDGSLAATRALTIEVLNRGEGPVITSGGGGDSASVSVAENTGLVTTVVADDPDASDSPFSFSIAGGADAALFIVDAQTGQLFFKSSLGGNFEAPADADGNNVYDVVVSVSDGALTDSQALAVSVSNVNEGVTIAGSQTGFVVLENDSAVAAFAATDGDGDAVTWSIAGGADAARFAIDPTSGALSFVAAPDFEAAGDSGADNVYDVVISASDGSLPATRALTIEVADRNEGPVIVSGGGGDSASVSVAENIGLVTTIVADDPDAVDSPRSFSIVGGADAGLFAIQAETGQLYLTVAGWNFEAPADSDGDHVYEVIVAVSDGSEPADTQALSVTVTDSNEAPVITSNGGGSSVALTFEEGTIQVATVAAGDPDGSTPVYSITGGNDAALFTVDSATGVVSFIEAPDYETRLDAHDSNIYEVIVTASDGELSDSQFLSVLITNVNEAVTITSGGGADSVAVTVAEDQGLVANVDAIDTDGTPVLYSIAGGADAAFFGIDPITGELYIAGADYDLPGDADGDNVYEVIVAADDGVFSDTQAFSVTLADVDEPLFFTSYASDFYVNLELGENRLDAAVVAAEDPEGRAIVYSIVDSYDGASFTIDAQTGAIQFLTAPNYEAPGDLDGDNVYTVLVAATDGAFFDYQNITIRVGDVNEAPAITSPAAISVAENGTAVSTVVAGDADGDPVSYAIAGGADALRFTIDAQTGALSFVQAPDFEAPADSDGDNVYDLIVSASDGALTGSQAVAVTVTNANEDIAITSDGGGASAQIWTLENGTAVTVVAASDPDGGPVTYAITGGADADRFTIDSSTGALAFVAAPDFETTRGAGGTNVFDVTVSASDGSSTDSQALTIILDNVVEGIFITSYGGTDSVSMTLTEGYYTTYDVDAWHDTEGFAPIYTLSGPDAAFFTIDNQGRFGFDYDAPPDFEGRADADGDNVYDVTVTASIGTYSDSQAFAITIVNRDESPVFTSGGGEPFASFTMAENGTVVTTLSAVDPEGGAVTYAIYGGFDAARFTIDPNTGVLSFVDAPDFEDPTDAAWNGSGYAERDNVYNVWITATDGTFLASQFVDVTVENVDEPIELLSYGGASAVALTLTEGTSLTVATVEAEDEEDSSVTYAITGGADAALFQINASTGVLAFNYGVYPDFEAPADAGGDNVYDVVVTASSSTSSVDQAFALTIADRNEGLWITSNDGGDANLTMNEGDRNVTTVTAEDQDGDVPTYSIVGGADAALFAIDPVTGALTFITAPDYEAPNSASGTNVYLVQVGASDGEFLGTQNIRVTIGNVNETPVITSGGGGATAAVTVNENGLVVTSIEAEDADDNGLTWSITGGADASLFTIEPWSGILRFVEGPNFEAPGDVGGDNVYDVVVSVTDGVLTDSQALAVTVANLNEAVAITSNGGGAAAAVTVAENGNVVTQVAASDPDGGAVTYAIAGGADAARFTINSSTGALSFVSAPNFEAPTDAGGNNVYDVVVSASDGSSTDTQALAVTVGNVNEGVTITSNGGGSSASVAVAENGTAVATVSAGDADGGAVTYAIAGGADSSRFTINAATGALAFIAAPNFEAPGDVGGDNVYDVLVSASDGTFTDTQALAVQVGNVNEAPAVTSNGGGASAAVSVAENSLAVTSVSAGDPDGTAATYSIVGGADAARFTINPQTGLLQFVAAPDYELPADSGGDNVYAVVVRASDGQLSDDQALSVTVTNVRDGNNVTGTSGSDSISATSLNLALRTSNAEDTVFGRDGHDNIQGMAGDDDLYGEGGNDTLIGGAGADRLTGGLGKDTYTYNAVSESSVMARDVILDFSRVQGDKISLSAIDANSLVSTNQAFTFIGTAAFSNVAGQLRYETFGGVTTISGDVNGDAVADLVIQLSGSIALISSDFIL